MFSQRKAGLHIADQIVNFTALSIKKRAFEKIFRFGTILCLLKQFTLIFEYIRIQVTPRCSAGSGSAHGWLGGTYLAVAIARQLGDEAHVVLPNLDHLLTDVILWAAA